MSKPEKTNNPADRGPETRTDAPDAAHKKGQREGVNEPGRDISRGAEGDVRRASGMSR
ncbi:hypothetical protein [Erythrobacter sp. R86502]|uniref:hypothetical protein n=1 Tax=Erythrobacter sp. R86502 TaxID=3093846 RepID=UPI0036D2C7B8